MASNFDKIVRSKRSCCVVTCPHSEAKNPYLSFYRFPGKKWETDRKQQWIDVIKRVPYTNQLWSPTSNSRVCSVHFVGGKKSDNANDEAYIPSIFSHVKRKRKPYTRASDSIFGRTEFLHVSLIEDHQPDFEICHVKVEDFEEDFVDYSVGEQLRTITVGCQTDPCTEVDIDETSVLFCWNGGNDASTQTQIFIQKLQKCQNSTIANDKQVTKNQNSCKLDPGMNSGFLGYPDIENDQTMQQLGGVSRNFFFVLLKLIEPGKNRQPKSFQTIGKENRLLLFLMKLKLGISFCALGCFFHIHSDAASSIFFEILQTLTTKTKSWIFWPSKESVERNLPSIFHKFPNCRCIIDYTEMPTDTPPTVEQRVLMFSSHKTGFTMKCLIVVTPDGHICKVSKAYGGRSTNSFITNDSGFLKLMQPGDLVFSNKNYPQIKLELSKRNATLVVVPTAFNPQFTKEEIDEECDITSMSVRTHVQKAIQRIKDSRILSHIPVELLPHVDAIVHMCCVIANNQPPLIEEDDFI